jgi:hypothetical protein
MKNPSSLFLFSWTRLKDNQVEGAALWGLSVALREGTEIVNGQPKDTNRNTYATLRMGGLHEVDVEFIPGLGRWRFADERSHRGRRACCQRLAGELLGPSSSTPNPSNSGTASASAASSPQTPTQRFSRWPDSTT